PESEIVYVQGTGLIDPAQAAVPDEVLCRDKACVENGLTATYFNSPEMSGPPVKVQTEANARQKWQGENRSGAVRWDGYIKAPESGEYRFRYDGDGGYRIWVND